MDTIETAAVAAHSAPMPPGRMRRAVPQRLSAALAGFAAITSLLSFTFFEVFERDAPSAVGNMRGTALTMLIVAVPLLVAAMIMADRGSLRARVVWLGALAYLAYNSVLTVFAAHFNSFFLMFVATLSLSIWSLLALLRDFAAEEVRARGARVPVRLVAVYMLACTILFAFVWLRDIGPAMMANSIPSSFGATGLLVAPTHVLDFAFTFPLLIAGARGIWARRGWGFVISGGLLIMLTIDTLSIALDQVFGHYHDPAQSLGAVPLMAVLTLIGSAMSFLFLSRLAVPRTAAEVGRRREAARPVHYPPAPRPRRPMWY